MAPTLRSSAIDLEAVFDRLAAETGIVVTMFDVSRLESGIMARRAGGPPYRNGDLTWDDVGNGHIQLLRWDGPNAHWPKRLLAARLIHEQYGPKVLYQTLRSLVFSLSEGMQ